MCVILANFTDSLVGYEHDVHKIATFFRERGYEVVGGSDDRGEWRNLTASSMRERLAELTRRLRSENTSYQRLFVFILSALGRLSHCDVTSDAPEDDFSPRELVSAITNVDKLRSVPKLFFVHNCSSAYDARVNKTVDGGATWQHATEFELSAHNMLFYKSLDLAHRSIVVPGHGSWLVETIVQAFRDFEWEYSVRDILAMVNRHIGKLFDEDGRSHRLPSWLSTLASPFFLTQH